MLLGKNRNNLTILGCGAFQAFFFLLHSFCHCFSRNTEVSTGTPFDHTLSVSSHFDSCKTKTHSSQFANDGKLKRTIFAAKRSQPVAIWVCAEVFTADSSPEIAVICLFVQLVERCRRI